MHSAIYDGWVRHRRFSPVDHHFRYKMFMMYLDLSELDSVFRGNPLWSSRRPAAAWFRRADHAGDPARPLDECIRDVVEKDGNPRPEGPIRLLTHLRYFGYIFNPVSFYYCFDRRGEDLEAIVADVANTPWNERHLYVLPASRSHAAGRAMAYRFDKQFHVSPFMEMDHLYQWRFSPPGEALAVHMENLRGGEKVFDATMTLRRRAVTPAALTGILMKYPVMTGKVIAGIYWNALRLHLKGAPFHAHPSKRAVAPGAAK